MGAHAPGTALRARGATAAARSRAAQVDAVERWLLPGFVRAREVNIVSAPPGGGRNAPVLGEG